MILSFRTDYKDVTDTMAQITIDSYDQSNASVTIGVGAAETDKAFGQSFQGANGTLTKVDLLLKNGAGTPTGNMYVKIYAHSGTFGTSSVPTGSPLATSEPVNATFVEATEKLVTFNFTGNNRIDLTTGTNYVVVIDCTAVGSSGNYIGVRSDSTPADSGNSATYNGTSWSASGFSDMIYYVYAENAPVVDALGTTSVGSIKATLQGDIVGVGGASVTKRGFVYGPVSKSNPGNTAPSATQYESYTEETGTYSADTFSIQVSDLVPAKTYYFRAFAYNSNGYTYGNQVEFTTGNLTRVTFNSQDPTAMLRSIIDAYRTRGGKINYATGTTDLTGSLVSYEFNTATVYEGAKKCLELAPSDWYLYVDIATSTIYFKQTSTTPDHIFIKGRHINSLKLTASIENVKNLILFTGGDDGGGTNLFAQYKDENSIEKFGQRLERKTDNRVTLQKTADAIGESYRDQNKNESYHTIIEIMDDTYDTTLLNVGDTVSIRGFNNFADNLILQIVRLERNSHKAKMMVGSLPVRLTPFVEQVRRDLIAVQTIANPSAPSYN